MKRWIINKKNEKLLGEILMRTDLNSLCAEVIAARSFSSLDEVEGFFKNATLSDSFSLQDMERAVEAINEAVENGDLIAIYGDYDCDGVTATVIIYNYLENMGANCMYYIPERNDGYGLNCNAINKLNEMSVKLIVTVDNGITAIDEAEEIYRLGMKLVVTDHHQPLDILPRAEAVVDPHRADCNSSFKDLCGAGVAMKLCAALDGGSYEAVMEQYSDIAAIGTIADVVPLVSENRTIVQTGLMLLENSESLGMLALIEKAGLAERKISSGIVAFGLAPKINAAGRFGSPMAAVKTLLAEDEEDAADYSEHLINLNNMRKACEQEILGEIFKCIDLHPEALDERVLIFCGEGWHHGVIGIISSKLMDIFGKPNIIISIEGDVARGSARSIKGFNIFECLCSCSDLLIKYGGHECAGGITLKTENLQKLCDKVAEYSKNNYPSMPKLEIAIDKVLRSADITVENAKALEILEPFGESNPQPVFAMLGARAERIVPLSNGKHTRLEVSYDNALVSVLIFSVSPEDTGIAKGDILDLLVTLETNEYNGKTSVSIKAKDYRSHHIKQERYFAAKDCYERIKRGEPIDDKLKKIVVPSMKELTELLDYLKTINAQTRIDFIYSKILSDTFNYAKYRNCLDIFEELNFIEINHSAERVTYTEKTFAQSKVMQKLCNL